MNFELLQDKVKARDLSLGDHVMVQDKLWRVAGNFPVIGGAGRMLMLAYHTHVDPNGYKFHQVSQADERFDVLVRTD
jgi:hypothetical protein